MRSLVHVPDHPPLKGRLVLIYSHSWIQTPFSTTVVTGLGALLGLLSVSVVPRRVKFLESSTSGTVCRESTSSLLPAQVVPHVNWDQTGKTGGHVEETRTSSVEDRQLFHGTCGRRSTSTCYYPNPKIRLKVTPTTVLPSRIHTRIL